MVVLVDKRRIKQALKDANKLDKIKLPPLSELKRKKKALKQKKKELKKFAKNFKKKKKVFDSI